MSFVVLLSRRSILIAPVFQRRCGLMSSGTFYTWFRSVQNPCHQASFFGDLCFVMCGLGLISCSRSEKSVLRKRHIHSIQNRLCYITAEQYINYRKRFGKLCLAWPLLPASSALCSLSPNNIFIVDVKPP